MKKYMTVAALLAAGTAFSNAAIETELLWGLDFTSGLELSSDSQSTATVGGSADSIDTTGGLFGTGSYTTGTNKLTLSGLSLGDGNSVTLSFHAKYNSGSGNWPILATFGSSSSYQYKLTYYTGDSTLVVDKDGYAEMVGSVSNDKVLATDFTPSSDWTHYAIVFSNNTLSVYVDGTQIGTGTIAVTDSVTQIVLGGRINASNTSDLTLSDIAIYRGALEADQISYLSANKANASAIPEPSAFGLLAGVGALALVAARRRRSK